ncbi:MAG: hypothetical protein JWQ13_781 [Ramlibacter sp.]|nr:hypothetical protein [Ramlibacter sp.]
MARRRCFWLPVTEGKTSSEPAIRGCRFSSVSTAGDCGTRCSRPAFIRCLLPSSTSSSCGTIHFALSRSTSPELMLRTLALRTAVRIGQSSAWAPRPSCCRNLPMNAGILPDRLEHGENLLHADLRHRRRPHDRVGIGFQLVAPLLRMLGVLPLKMPGIAPSKLALIPSKIRIARPSRSVAMCVSERPKDRRLGTSPSDR